MVRTFILGVLLLAAARGAADDGTAPAQGTPEAAGSAPATAQSVGTAKRGAKKQTASTKAGDGKAGPAVAANHAAQPDSDVKMSGMSILGNEDAPKSLVLVPWKSSQLGDMPSVSRLLDSAAQPVDKDVFMRELAYYEFKSSSK
jgi:hypothetical protein